MEAAVIRRIIFGVFGVGFLVMGAEQYRGSDHVGLAIGLALVGIFLLITALTGKGG